MYLQLDIQRTLSEQHGMHNMYVCFLPDDAGDFCFASKLVYFTNVSRIWQDGDCYTDYIVHCQMFSACASPKISWIYCNYLSSDVNLYIVIVVQYVTVDSVFNYI